MSEVSECYASALLELSIEENKVNDYLSQAKVLVTLLDDKVLHFLSLGLIDKNIKKQQIKEWFKDFEANIINLCCLVVDKGRSSYLREIMMLYVHKANEYLNIKEVCVVSAKPLSEDIKEKLKAAIGAKYDCEVELTTKIDESLISGFKVIYDAKVIDMTMKKKVSMMRHELLESW